MRMESWGGMGSVLNWRGGQRVACKRTLKGGYVIYGYSSCTAMYSDIYVGSALNLIPVVLCRALQGQLGGPGLLVGGHGMGRGECGGTSSERVHGSNQRS
jgi:hypothetical protein